MKVQLLIASILSQTTEFVNPTLNDAELKIWTDFQQSYNTVNYDPCKGELEVVVKQAINAYNNAGVAPNFFSAFRRIGNQSGDIDEAKQFRDQYNNFLVVIDKKQAEYNDVMEKRKQKAKEDAATAEALAAQVANQAGDEGADEVVTALSEEEKMGMYGVDTNGVMRTAVSLLSVASLALLF